MARKANVINITDKNIPSNDIVKGTTGKDDITITYSVPSTVDLMIDGLGGGDRINLHNAGTDTVVYYSNDKAYVGDIRGRGFDILDVNTSHIVLDFKGIGLLTSFATDFLDGKPVIPFVTGFAELDLTSGGHTATEGNTVNIDPLGVAVFTRGAHTQGTLIINDDQGDTINIGSGWTSIPTPVFLNGIQYQEYTDTLPATHGYHTFKFEPLTLYVEIPISVHQTSTQTMYIGQSETLNLKAAFTDANPPLIYTITDNGVANAVPAGLTFVNGVLSGTPTMKSNEADDIAVTATDSLGNTATDSFILNIKDPLDPLTININADTTESVTSGGSVDLTKADAFVEANPSLEGTLTYSTTTTLPAGFSLNADGVLSVPNNNDPTEITVTATDRLQNKATDTFTINVMPLFYYTNIGAGGSPQGLATDNSNHVWAWGSNINPVFGGFLGTLADLGTSTIQASSVPLEIQGAAQGTGMIGFGATAGSGLLGNQSPIVDVAGGQNTSFALGANGEVYAWGQAASLGVGQSFLISYHTGTIPSVSATPLVVLDAITNQNYPFKGGIGTPLTNIVQLVEGSNNNYAIDNSGHLWAWGSNNIISTDPTVENYNGVIPTKFLAGIASEVLAGAQNPSAPTTTFLSNIVDVAAQYDVYAVDTSGHVYAWGLYNTNGQLGIGSDSNDVVSLAREVVAGAQNPSAPTSTFLSHIVAVASGSGDGYALDNQGHVWAWGYNSNGTLGNGAANLGKDSNTPVEVVGGAQLGHTYLSNIISIAAGGVATYALDSEGHVWAWGKNLNHELGNGTVDSAAPVEVLAGPHTTDPLSNIVAISATTFGAYALDSSGHIWAWGDNNYGELGNGATNLSLNFPSSASGSLATEIVGNAVSLGINLINLSTENGAVGLPGESYPGTPSINEVLDFSNPAQDYLVLRVTNAVVETLASATLAAHPSDLPTNANLITTAELNKASTFTHDNKGPGGTIETQIHFAGGGEITLEGVIYTSFESFPTGHLIFNHAG